MWPGESRPCRSVIILLSGFACFLQFSTYCCGKIIIGESFMNLEFSAEENAFRDEVRSFIENNYPTHIQGKNMQDDMSREELTAWHKILGKKGWSDRKSTRLNSSHVRISYAV